MKHAEGYFSGIRNQRLYHQSWLPETEPKAALLVVHGLAEHGGRYMNLVNHFVPLGYAVHTADHPGHGRSGGRRCHVERFADFTSTLLSFRQIVADRQKEKPLFLIGHSMGGLIGALHLITHQAGLAGAVLSGPAVKPPAEIPPLTLLAGRLLSVLLPWLGLIQLEAEGISRDPAVVKAYRDDPLVFRGKMTARLGAEMVDAMKQVAAQASRINLPLLILQGSEDRLVDPTGAQRLHDAVGSADRTLIRYEGLYHEVFNEPERGRVLRDVELWLESHSR